MRELVIEFMRLTDMDKRVRDTVEVILGQLENGLNAIAAGQEANIEAGIKLARTELFAGLPGFLDKVVAVYEKHFQREDLEAIVAFYKTPAGRKLIESGVALQEDISAAADAWTEGVLHRTQPAMMKAAGIN